MSAERPSEATVDALAKVLYDEDHVWLHTVDGSPNTVAYEMARNVLASDWLAAHDAQVRADRDIHFASPGPERANFRSATPMGFARAVFNANSKSGEVAA